MRPKKNFLFNMININKRSGLSYKRQEVAEEKKNMKVCVGIRAHCKSKRCSPCFFTVVTDKKGNVEIRFEKNETNENLELCKDVYSLCKESGKQIAYYNYKSNLTLYYSPETKNSGKWEREVPISEVDTESLVGIIKDLIDENVKPFVKKGRLDRFYLAVLYKMYKGGAFGSEKKYRSQQNFFNLFDGQISDVGSLKNMNLHFNNLKGDYPRISINQNNFIKNTESKDAEIEAFIKEIDSRYKEKQTQR